MSQYTLQIRNATRKIIAEVEVDLDEFIDYDEWIMQSIEDYEEETYERGEEWDLNV